MNRRMGPGPLGRRRRAARRVPLLEIFDPVCDRGDPIHARAKPQPRLCPELVRCDLPASLGDRRPDQDCADPGCERQREHVRARHCESRIEKVGMEGQGQAANEQTRSRAPRGVRHDEAQSHLESERPSRHRHLEHGKRFRSPSFFELEPTRNKKKSSRRATGFQNRTDNSQDAKLDNSVTLFSPTQVTAKNLRMMKDLLESESGLDSRLGSAPIVG